MYVQKITAWAVAASLGLASTAALAQPRPHDAGPARGHAPHMQPHHSNQRPALQAPHQRPMPQPIHARPGAKPAHPHGMPPGHAKRMGAGPQQQWVKGSRVPQQYRSKQYVVNDWRGHGLHRPPRGHQWVQYGGDYLLVAIASGVIAQLILSH